MFLTYSRFFLYVSLFSVAVVLPSTFFPFIGGKYYFFRIAIEIAAICFLLFWAFQASEGWLLKKMRSVVCSPLFIAVTAFVVVFLLASLFAHDPNAAFWSNYERGDGGFQMLHYYGFFVLLLLVMEKSDHWRGLFKLAVVSALLMILYGVLAQGVIVLPGVTSPDPETNKVLFTLISPFSQGNFPEGAWARLIAPRFQGSLGNPAYVAPYLMFAMFYALYLWWQKNPSPKSFYYGGILFSSFILGVGLMILADYLSLSNEREWMPRVLPWISFLSIAGTIGWGVFKKEWRSLAYVSASSVFLFFFVLSQTRGAFLGLFAAAVAFLGYLVFAWPRGRKWIIGILCIGALLCGTLLMFRDSGFVRSIPGSRFLELADQGFDTQTVQTRIWTWGAAWKGFTDRPILGWGPENFSTVFDKHFDVRHFVPGKNSETWFDRAHSVAFDYLSETGVLGFLSFFSIFFFLFFVFFSKTKQRIALRNQGSLGSVFIQALLFSLLVGYLVQGLALFDVLAVYINLFLMFAFFIFLFEPERFFIQEKEVGHISS